VCADGLGCAAATDCQSARCVNGTCQAAGCNDSVKNGGESDVDCGGATSCARCPNGKTCSAATDCTSAYCSTTCTTPPVLQFPFTPTNFVVAGLDALSTDDTTLLDCGVSTFDSGTLAFGNWCGQNAPTPMVETQAGGSDVVVVPVRNLTLAAGSTIRLTGNRPVVFAVFGNATIAGTIDAGASGTAPGPGGNVSCGTSQGGNGSGETKRLGGASGGGGGGFGTAGGKGGKADTDGSSSTGGIAGIAHGSAAETPLVAGCAGGMAGDCTTAGGAGGGAVEVSVAGALKVSGTVRSDGGAGATPCGASDEGGGTGGGSGGAILLEGAMLDLTGSTLHANGGNGGKNGSYAGVFNCGGDNGGNGATSATNAGANGSDCQGGSSGGGGGYGRVTTLDR
jgi:hypothetical protein